MEKPIIEGKCVLVEMETALRVLGLRSNFSGGE